MGNSWIFEILGQIKKTCIVICAIPFTAMSQNTHKSTNSKIILPSPPVLQLVDVQPYPIDESELKKNIISGVTIYSGPDEKPLTGYYMIVYKKQTQTLDISHEQVYASATGHFLQGLHDGKWLMRFFNNIDGLNYCENYKKGLLDGEFIVYNLDQTVRYETTFKQGSGLWKSFYSNGALRVVGSYYNGCEQGAWITYSPDGSKNEENVYDQVTLKETRKF